MFPLILIVLSSTATSGTIAGTFLGMIVGITAKDFMVVVKKLAVEVDTEVVIIDGLEVVDVILVVVEIILEVVVGAALEVLEVLIDVYIEEVNL